MLASFLTATQVVVPMALLMLLGAGLRKAGLTDRSTMRSVDKLLFRFFMPVLFVTRHAICNLNQLEICYFTWK